MCNAGMVGGLSGAGLAVSAVGAYKGAQARKSALEYDAAVASNNQRLAEYQAGLALENGAVQEQSQQLKTADALADQRAALAANGVDLGEGSPNEILATTRFMGKRDELQIRDNAVRQAWGYRQQASAYGTEAAANRAAAAATKPFLTAAGSLMTNAGTVASTWYRYAKANGK